VFSFFFNLHFLFLSFLFVFVYLTYYKFLQQNYQEQLDAYKREIKTLRSEFDQVHADHPYYVGGSGGADADDKVDDDPVRRQQRAHDWAATDDPSKVRFMNTNMCHNFL